ncbi:MAG: hypothetical protein ACYCVB_13565, partial [Bacilli bacterium]
MSDGRAQYVMSLLQRNNTLSAAIVDGNGQVTGAAERVFDDGKVAAGELDADALLSGAITLIETALRRADISAWELSAIGVAAGGDLLAIWDSVSGTPLAPIRPFPDTDLTDAEVLLWVEAWLQEVSG